MMNPAPLCLSVPYRELNLFGFVFQIIPVEPVIHLAERTRNRVSVALNPSQNQAVAVEST
jgi:hypothetical protein